MIIKNCLYCHQSLKYEKEPDTNAPSAYIQCYNQHELPCLILYLSKPYEESFNITTIDIGFDNKYQDQSCITEYIDEKYCSIYIWKQLSGLALIQKIDENYATNHSLSEIRTLLLRIENLMVFS